MSDDTTATSSTSTESAKPAKTASGKAGAAPKTDPEPTPGQADMDANTAREDAQRQYNQDRYDARLAGKSSAEINAEEEAAKLVENPPAPGLPDGGQTSPE